ncbi:MAG: Hsp20/alpha crystallin family protein [Treponema sp.]|nr:Hsp20/alpha crystallin family protein [Treponema sp.]
MNALSLFNDWLNNDCYGLSGYYGTNAQVPNVDVTESKDSYVIDMDLPGRNENDVNLELNEGVLTISSEKTETKQIEDKSEAHEEAAESEKAEKPQYLLRERRSTSFRRSFTLPKDIDADGVTAGFKNGVLTVKIPRKAEVAPRKIQINIA